MSQRSRSKSRSKLRSKTGTKKKMSCKDYLRKKIEINMREFKEGRFKTAKQAIAVSYSQVRKKHPRCLL
jgi:hypothetical protein